MEAKRPAITAETRALFRRAIAASKHDCSEPECELCERAHELSRELHRALGLKIWACSPLDVHRATPPPDETSPERGWREAWALRKELLAS